MRSRWVRNSTQPVLIGALGFGLVVAGCGGEPKPSEPDATRINLALKQVLFTQVVQDEDGSLPLVAGAPASAKVTVVRSAETVDAVTVVLRLFRSGVLVHSDTAQTGGVLGPSSSLLNASAEFLVPGTLVSSDVSWQVVLDPLRQAADSTRTDNVLPRQSPAALQVVELRPIRVRLVPVILTQHGDATGNVSVVTAESYVRVARQIFPSKSFIVSVGNPVRSAAFAGPPPVGGDAGFWQNVIGDVDQARMAANAGDEIWYGVVMEPSGYDRIIYRGYGYIPSTPLSTGTGTLSAAGYGITSMGGAPLAQTLLAHELGHVFGRWHPPGCGAGSPIDSLYPAASGAITGLGHDVWSWANGLARGARSIAAAESDVMSYCQTQAPWIGPYTHDGLIRWRRVDGVVTKPAGLDPPPVAMP